MNVGVEPLNQLVQISSSILVGLSQHISQALLASPSKILTMTNFVESVIEKFKKRYLPKSLKEDDAAYNFYQDQLDFIRQSFDDYNEWLEERIEKLHAGSGKERLMDANNEEYIRKSDIISLLKQK